MKDANTCLDWQTLAALSEEHGPSFFILDLPKFRSNFQALRAAFRAHYPAVEIGYSYKTNYTPHLCYAAHEEGGYAEVVSEMEYAAAKRLNIPGERIIYNGPYKADWSFLEAAHSGATLNLDSQRDLQLLRQAAEAQSDKTIKVVLRTNFAIGADVSRFGFDVSGEEFRLALQTLDAIPNAELFGLHCHFPDRDLDSFRRRAEGLVALAHSVFPDRPPRVLNIGGGYFSRMPESLRRTRSEPPATFEDYGEVIGQVLSKAFAAGPEHPTLFIEPGTALVADCQVFYTQVISTKSVRGRHFATVAGSIFDISPNAKSKVLPVTSIRKQDVQVRSGSPVAIVGFTCIEGDILTEDFDGELATEDFVAYGNVGSYSLVMRPPFILPSNPVLMRDDMGILSLIKARQSNSAPFDDFTDPL